MGRSGTLGPIPMPDASTAGGHDMSSKAAPRIVGLDIGSSGIRAAEVRRLRSGALRIDRLASAELEPGIIRNGVVEQPKALAKALRRLWRRGHFSTRKVAFGLSDTGVLTRQLDLPWMQPADFRAALRYQVQDALPVSVASSELDYHLLAEIQRTDAGGQSADANRVLVVAANRDAVTADADAIRKAGLEPIAADSMGFALIRSWCRGQVPDDPAVHAIADIGADQVTVLLISRGQPLFIRTVANLGGGAATATLAGRLDLDLDDAEALKRETGLNGPAPVIVPIAESSVFSAIDTVQAAAPDSRTAVALDVLNPWATTVVQEIRNTIDYFRSTAPGTNITSLTVAGRAIQLNGLLERMATELPYPVRAFDPLAGMEAHARVRKHRPPDARFAAAIGLGMRGPQ